MVQVVEHLPEALIQIPVLLEKEGKGRGGRGREGKGRERGKERGWRERGQREGERTEEEGRKEGTNERTKESKPCFFPKEEVNTNPWASVQSVPLVPQPALRTRGGGE
jgi:hypothetical protein